MTLASAIDDILPGRTLPVINVDTAPFFEAAAEGRLVLQRCKETGRFQWYPRACSIYTFGEVEWVEASGKGRVYSFTIVRNNAVDPVFRDLVPYAIGLIELPEGVRMMGNITGCDLKDIHVGMEVEVYFAPMNADRSIHMPFWKPAA